MRAGMIVAAVAVVAAGAASCIDFEADYQRCVDGGACVASSTSDGSVDAGGDDGGPDDTDAGEDAGTADAGRDAGTQWATCNERGVCWENPLPQGNTLNAVFTFGPGDTWVAGNRGMLAHWDGVQWRAFGSFETWYPLNDLWGRPGDGWLWMVGFEVSGRWNGATWRKYASVGGSAVAGDPDGGSIWRTRLDDNGQGWSSSYDAEADVWGAEVSGPGGADLWHSPSGYFGLHESGVFGPGAPTAWQQTPANFLGTINLRRGWSGAGADWVAGDRETLFRRDGGTWTEVRDGGASAGAYSGIWGESADTLYLVTGTGKFVRYDQLDGGLTDLRPPGVTLPEMRDVHGSASNNVWAVGDGGVIVRSTGTGTGRVDKGLRLNLERVRSASGYQLAVGEQGLVMARTSTGWQQDKTFTCPQQIADVRLMPSGDALALCYGQVVARTGFDGGWDNDPPHDYFYVLWATALDHAFASDGSGNVYARSQGGTWQLSANQPGAGRLALLWGTPDESRLFALADTSGQVLSRTGESAWQSTTTLDGGPEFMPYVALSDGQRSWVGGYPNTLCRIEDDGGYGCESGFGGGPVVELELCGANGLCALTGEGLYRATDKMSPQWQLIRLGNEPTARGLAVDGQTAYVVGDNGMILRVELP